VSAKTPTAKGGGTGRPPRGYKRKSYAVWELTLKCNLACIHCGSRAGPARENELTTAEALDLVRQMADLGIGEVSLIGGEAFLRPDWLEIAAELSDAGILCSMTTGGYGISVETARRMKAAGIAFVSVSIDGLEENHDRQRGKAGSWQACFQTMGHFREIGMTFGCNTQLNRLTAPEIPRLYELIRDAGAVSWQPQMTVPMGNAADNAWLLLQPAELLEFYPALARVAYRANREKVAFMPGSSVGYFGPYETIIREHHLKQGQFWMGCQAGLSGIGIEADGKIKGDPSLPTDYYTGGNIREKSLREIMDAPEMKINLGGGTPEGVAHLWGFCKTCEFADLCRGGCSWSSHVFFNRRGNNVYCHHRALEMAKRGRRERVRPQLMAIGKPFDNGVFEIIEEPLDAPWPAGDDLRFTKEKMVWPAGWEAWPEF
jgi:nif11-class peptide radical SAM maturase 3